jgi:hypothetical protein
VLLSLFRGNILSERDSLRRKKGKCGGRRRAATAISNGSACTSSSYTPSHVIKAMGYSDDEANEAICLSWCHLTPEVDWEAVAARIGGLR